MRIVFDNFKDFKEEKPETFDTCLIFWESSSGKEHITVGIYYEEKKAFHDGIGAWLEEEHVIKWCHAWNYSMDN